MPSVPLPENASIEHLKNQAKLVQRLVRDGDDGALAMVREFHPTLTDAEPASPQLTGFSRADAQLVIARLYGAPSWPRLREEVELAHEFTAPDSADRPRNAESNDLSAKERFVSLACVSYNPVDPHARLAEAARMLDAEPSLAATSPAAMAATGNHQALAEALLADGSLATRAVGPNNWPLILYCTYSRVLSADPAASAVATARLLLDAGADANAGFLWRGLVPPFTALTGALGGGEGDQPRHPQWIALAEILLGAGADANDGQGLYNNGLAGTAHDDPTHLRLLHEHGLGQPQDGPWYRQFGHRLTPPAELLYDELEVAAWRGLPDRARFLVDLGLDLDRGVGRSSRRPLDLAQEQGHNEVVAILRSAGASH